MIADYLPSGTYSTKFLNKGALRDTIEKHKAAKKRNSYQMQIAGAVIES